MTLSLLRDDDGGDGRLTCQSAVKMEEVMLTYLADNVGEESTFRPVCAYLKDDASGTRQVPNDEGGKNLKRRRVVGGMALEFEVTFSVARGDRELSGPDDDDPGNFDSTGREEKEAGDGRTLKRKGEGDNDRKDEMLEFRDRGDDDGKDKKLNFRDCGDCDNGS